MTTLVDTNLIIDLVDDDPEWADWSAAGLHEARQRGRLLINDIIYAEASIRFPAMESLDALLISLELENEPIKRPALFAAGKAFRAYRENDGPRTTILPDFFIGAHAQALDCPLLTRDVRRYRTYFPKVRLITP